jgi:hypothetical protein
MKTVQILLPDHLHEQLQRKAAETGFDVTAYILALLSESVTPSSKQVRVSISASPKPPAPKVLQQSSPQPAVEPRPPIPLSPRPLQSTSSHPQGGTKGPQSNMSVVIRWDIIGKGASEAIRAATAAATLVRVIQRLHQVYGAGTLEKIEKFRVSRGPLVSRNPGRDFTNRSSMETYVNHPIPGTGYFVLTHSSTDQKIQDLKELLNFLKLPAPMLEIAKHRKA